MDCGGGWPAFRSTRSSGRFLTRRGGGAVRGVPRRRRRGRRGQEQAAPCRARRRGLRDVPPALQKRWRPSATARPSRCAEARSTGGRDGRGQGDAGARGAASSAPSASALIVCPQCRMWAHEIERCAEAHGAISCRAVVARRAAPPPASRRVVVICSNARTLRELDVDGPLPTRSSSTRPRDGRLRGPARSRPRPRGQAHPGAGEAGARPCFINQGRRSRSRCRCSRSWTRWRGAARTTD